MTTDVITLAFMVGASVLLAVLWRRGPDRRRAFYVTCILAAGSSMALQATLDDLGRVFEEFREGVDRFAQEVTEDSRQRRPAPVPSATPNAPRVQGYDAAGVSVEFPADWRVREASDRDFRWMHPKATDTTRWEPLLHVRYDLITCSLVDATEYVDGLGLVDLDRVLEWELEGFAQPDDPSAPRDRLARRLTRFQSDLASSGTFELQGDEVAFVDVTAWRGWSTWHHFLERVGRWLYLTCDSNRPPSDDWRSIVESVTVAGATNTADR